MTKTRRALIALLATAAIAVPTLAPAAEKLVEAAKIFQYLDAFLKVPPGERSHVRLGYGLLRDGKPATGIQAWLVAANGARSPLPVSATGVFEKLPTLAELRSGAKVAFNLDESIKLGTRMMMDANIRPATEIDAHEVSVCIAEANSVIGKAAGPMALVAPKMVQVVFIGSPSGVAVMADGKTAPLPTYKGLAVFNPSAMPGAVKVRLVKAPSRVAFAPKT